MVRDAEIEASIMTGQNEHFDQLLSWYTSNRLTRQQLATHLLSAWVGAEWPHDTAALHVEDSGIVEMFRIAGFLTDDGAVSPPSAPMLLYRGCTVYGAAGFSWTADPETARWFAKRGGLFRPVIVAAIIEPDHILAIVTSGRDESEAIVDPIGAIEDIEAGVFLRDLDTPDIPAAVHMVFVQRGTARGHA